MEGFALKQFAQKVYDYCGLNYTSNLAALEAKMSKRIRELNVTWWEYQRLLNENLAEWDVVVELLTINETYFYREEKQLHAYTKYILPELQANQAEEINIWSAACSTGEEPYSLAMMTLDAGRSETLPVKITASDINKKVLDMAEKGLYHKRSLSFRRIPEHWLTQYFEDRDPYYEVITPLKNMVSFEHLNLLNQEHMINQRDQFDVIFCRNVLIYFDQATVKKVVSYFHDALKKGGYLFLGHAETISQMGVGFESVSKDGTFYYRKKE